MRYTAHNHRHNFAVWAAARATQRGFTDVKTLKCALEVSGVESFARRPIRLGQFNDQHRVWCMRIMNNIEQGTGKYTSYGRAAKLVNTYLKTMLVLRDPMSKAAAVIHPPIDRILLRNIATQANIEESTKRYLRGINWTSLEEGSYFELICVLREINGNQPFWMIEEYWTVTN